jgi:antitoxin PrlF
MQLSRLSAKGQVTVPKEVRDFLELKPGDMIAYEVQNGTVILRRAEPFDAAFHKALSATLDEWATPEDEEAFRDL